MSRKLCVLLLGLLCLMCRYEQVLHHLTTYVRQQAQRQARLALLPHAVGSTQAAAVAPAAPAAQAPAQRRQALADVATAAFTQALGVLQPTIAVHMAQCYAALSDWQHFRDFVAAQHRKAQTDPQVAAWWRPCMSTAQMQDICALGSFDVNGPLSPELKVSMSSSNSPSCTIISDCLCL